MGCSEGTVAAGDRPIVVRRQGRVEHRIRWGAETGGGGLWGVEAAAFQVGMSGANQIVW